MSEITARAKSFFESYKGEALIYVLITIGGSLMPLWGGLLLYELLTIDNELWIFVDAGQFYIYSAALFTPSCYFLYKAKNPNNISHSFWFLLSFFLLIASAILFAGISILKVTDTSTQSGIVGILNHGFLRKSSLLIFFFSIVTAFVAQAVVLKLRSGGPNTSQVNDDRDNDYDDLSDDFDKLEE